MTTATGELMQAWMTRPTGTFRFARPVEALPEATPPQPLPSDNRPDKLSGPIRIPAPWLGAVERRLNTSVGVADLESLTDGRCISVAIASGALQFFRYTSDLLPSEPYLYTSTRGDLVAESKAGGRTITIIVGRSSVDAYAVVEDRVEHRPIPIEGANEGDVRRLLGEFVQRVK